MISIVTITLNNLAGLKKTAQSIATQNFSNFEWIIIDGQSHDGTQEFLKTLNNTMVISEEDNGIYDAMNKGARLATGQYILFLNAGDALADKNILSQISNAIKENQYDFIYGDSIENQDNKDFFKPARSHKKIISGMFTHHQAMIYNTKFFKDFGYDRKYLIAADYDLTWRILNKSKNILYIPIAICIFEAGGVSQKNVLLGRIEQFKIRKSHNISLLKNLSIFAAQTLIYNLRRFFPWLYWLLKRA